VAGPERAGTLDGAKGHRQHSQVFKPVLVVG
jgi:hypothetical protein